MKLPHKLAYLSLSVVSAAALAGGAMADDKYVIGVSNTLIGNGWREEMICSIKAQAEASGLVSKVIIANRNGGPAEQIADLRKEMHGMRDSVPVPLTTRLRGTPEKSIRSSLKAIDEPSPSFHLLAVRTSASGRGDCFPGLRWLLAARISRCFWALARRVVLRSSICCSLAIFTAASYCNACMAW